MTQAKAESTLPSMVNYPEPSVGQTVNKFGFDSKGIRYKITTNNQHTDIEPSVNSKESDYDK